MENALSDQPETALDYKPCRFEGTKLEFRGPAVDMGAPFVAVLGGSETFGKYVAHPFPELLGGWTGRQVMNLGVAQAGVSLFSAEQWLLDTASRAELTIFQVLGAQNMSNRLYYVHSRRNDRFLGVSPALRTIFPETDFAEINFTGHLLETLAGQSPAGFDVLVEELRWAWVQRMRRILTTIQGDVLLLWIGDRRPEETRGTIREGEPLFVDRAMLDELRSDCAGLVEVVLPGHAAVEGKVFPEAEREAARTFPGPADHARIAEALVERLGRMRDDPGLAQGAARA